MSIKVEETIYDGINKYLLTYLAQYVIIRKKGGVTIMAIVLNASEMRQFQDLIKLIRSDPPHTPRPAREHIDLIRGRVCVYLNQMIDRKAIQDVFVNRSGPVDLYYHQ